MSALKIATPRVLATLSVSIFNEIGRCLVHYRYQLVLDDVWNLVETQSHAYVHSDDCQEIVESFLDRTSFVVPGKYGGTALHALTRSGEVEMVKKILDARPWAVEVVTETGENCLHIAFLNNQVSAVRFLVDWLAKNRDYSHLINGKDCGGMTPLHLAVSRKQIQGLEVLLACNLVDVNAMSSGGFTALDILRVLPCNGMIDVEIERILVQAGALRARDLSSRDTNQFAAQDDKTKCFKTTDMNTNIPFRASHVVLVLMAFLVGEIASQAVFHTLQLKKQVLVITRSFILFNSIGFVGSLAVVISLLNEFPFKPWSQISVSMLFGSYMCCIISMSPNEAWILLFLAIPLLLLAATGKLFGLGRLRPRVCF